MWQNSGSLTWITKNPELGIKLEVCETTWQLGLLLTRLRDIALRASLLAVCLGGLKDTDCCAFAEGVVSPLATRVFVGFKIK